MGKVIRFQDDGKACYSRVDWESGDPAFISVAQVGVLVKRSRLGILGVKLYDETDIHNCVAMSRVLDNHILSPSSISSLPPGLNGPVLQSFTRLAIEATSAVEFCTHIGEARRLVLQGH
jgi:hypothetical protein